MAVLKQESTFFHRAGVKFTLLLVICLTGCAVNKVSKYSEKQYEYDNRNPGSSINDNFCVHVKFSSTTYYLYREDYVEGWTTTGLCKQKGKRIKTNLSIRWTYSDHSGDHKSCGNSSLCVFKDRYYGTGTTAYVSCSSARAQLNGKSAFTTTDKIDCPN